jgi:hypothetical protein
MQKMKLTFIFKNNAHFFDENWEKSQKILIIASPPGYFPDSLKIFRPRNNNLSIDSVL